MDSKKKQNKRNRDVLMIFFVSENEKSQIQEKMKLAGIKNFSQYARKMLLDGYVVRQDFSEIKELIQVLGYLSRNINQIALRANQTRSIYQSDIEDLQRDYVWVKQKILNYLNDAID